MKKFFFLFLFFGWKCFSQQYLQPYYDEKHYKAVTENNVMRMTAEVALEKQTNKINENVNSINKNLAKVVATKNLIYNSLYEVNEVIKDGKEVKYIAQLLLDIKNEADGLFALTKDSPQYNVFAVSYGKRIYTTSLTLYEDVRTMVLTSNKDILMNYNSRDELLKKVVYKLQLLRAELYGARTSIYWAKMNGMWNSLNPFKSWINQDMYLINSIIINSKQL
ncbi:hypothetical protein [Flavobacterium daejeonense]|uniref:hypothetical protein n=1 Tax=Flavobacterium daejeonense TaxID=350893 RepID=UPI00047B137A|nr:hypothetical protein [Flavobacterium daejeonense]